MIKDLALIFIVASIVTILFKKLNQPVVLGYIVAGFLISPNFTYLPTVIESEDIHVWANIGVVFLMFALGLEFSCLLYTSQRRWNDPVWKGGRRRGDHRCSGRRFPGTWGAAPKSGKGR